MNMNIHKYSIIFICSVILMITQQAGACSDTYGTPVISYPSSNEITVCVNSGSISFSGLGSYDYDNYPFGGGNYGIVSWGWFVYNVQTQDYYYVNEGQNYNFNPSSFGPGIYRVDLYVLDDEYNIPYVGSDAWEYGWCDYCTIYVVSGNVTGEYDEIDSETGMDLYFELTPNYGWSYSEGSIYIKDEWDNLAYSTPITGLSGTIEWDGMGNQGCYDEWYLPPGPYDIGVYVDLSGDEINQKTDNVKKTHTPGKKYAGYRRPRLSGEQILGAEAKILTCFGKLSGEGSAQGNWTAMSLAYVNCTYQSDEEEAEQWAQTGFVKDRYYPNSSILARRYAEAVISSDPSTGRWVDIATAPTEGTPYKYKCILNKTTGQWDFYFENVYWTSCTWSGHLTFWTNKYCEQARFTGEIQNLEDDMPGTDGSRCKFEECKIHDGTQWKSTEFRAAAKYVSSPSGEWNASGPPSIPPGIDWFEIWDIHPIPVP